MSGDVVRLCDAQSPNLGQVFTVAIREYYRGGEFWISLLEESVPRASGFYELVYRPEKPFPEQTKTNHRIGVPKNKLP